MDMFCYQCEETAKGTGCTVAGVCGKDANTAILQDLLIYATKGIAMYAHRARQFGATDREVDVFVLEALFSTVTNVDFDAERLQQLLIRAGDLLERTKSMYEAACAEAGESAETLAGPAQWRPAFDIEGLVDQGQQIGIKHRQADLGEDIVGLQELITYALKASQPPIGSRSDSRERSLWKSMQVFMKRWIISHRIIQPSRGCSTYCHEDRQTEPAGHGIARRSQHRSLRSP